MLMSPCILPSIGAELTCRGDLVNLEFSHGFALTAAGIASCASEQRDGSRVPLNLPYYSGRYVPAIPIPTRPKPGRLSGCRRSGAFRDLLKSCRAIRIDAGLARHVHAHVSEVALVSSHSQSQAA